MRFKVHVNAAVPLLIATAALLAVSGCVHAPAGIHFEAGRIDAARVVPKVDEFVVIADGSLSMAGFSARQRKLEIGTAVATALVNTVPDGELPGAVRSFGQGRCLPRERTSSLYSNSSFASADAASAIASMSCAGGYSPLDLALKGAAGGLVAAPKKVAVFIVSDGMHMGEDEVQAARSLNDGLAGGACFYPIQVGADSYGRGLLDRLAAVSSCGRVVAADELTSSGAMAAFVKEALFDDDSDGDGVADAADRCPDTPAGVEVDESGCPPDSDGDGVADHLDRCPGTPAGVKVDENGCPPDSDGDGVADYLDRCPGTPAGVKVDDTGCPLDSDGDGILDGDDDCPNTAAGTPVDGKGCAIVGLSVEGDEWHMAGELLFDLNKAGIRAEAAAVLQQIAAWLGRNQDVSLLIEGHTDSTGSEEHNQKLSESRAESVKAFLVEQGTAGTRLSTVGKGESEPLVANDTEENRQRNRRVELKPKK